MKDIADSVIHYLALDKNRNSKEIYKMKLGIQILLHNCMMIGTILLVAFALRLLKEASILLLAFGLLKMSAGGIHLKRSSSCLFFTLLFILGGVKLSQYISIPFWSVMLLYGASIIGIYLLAPQGTENNPISSPDSKKMRRQAIVLVLLYTIITVIEYLSEYRIPYLLLIATVFETCSLIPLWAKKKAVFGVRLR